MYESEFKFIDLWGSHHDQFFFSSTKINFCNKRHRRPLVSASNLSLYNHWLSTYIFSALRCGSHLGEPRRLNPVGELLVHGAEGALPPSDVVAGGHLVRVLRDRPLADGRLEDRSAACLLKADGARVVTLQVLRPIVVVLRQD